VPPGGTKVQTGQRKRYDFVIFFLWKEPTPSDKLRFPNGEPPVETQKTPSAPPVQMAPPTAPAGGGKGGGDGDFDIKRGL
jgi:hypothetical protein